MAISTDLRQRVVADCQAGMSVPQVAEKYTVGSASVERWLRRYREVGSLEPISPPGRTPFIDACAQELLRKKIETENDLTLEELRDYWAGQGYPVARSTVAQWLDRLRLTLKKNDARKRTGPPRRSRTTRAMEGHRRRGADGNVGLSG